MLNIKINKIQKMDGFFGFGGGARKEERHNMNDGERIWTGQIQEGDILKIKALQDEIKKMAIQIDTLEKSASPDHAFITELGVKKLTLIKERNLEGNKIQNEEERKKLEKEIDADFGWVN
jgi:hypothetical protein